MRIKNNTLDTGTWLGQEIEAGSYYELQATEINQWANDSTVLTDLLSGDIKLEHGSLIEDGVMAVNTLLDNVPKEVVTAFEKNDKRLKCIRGEASYSSNECTITFPIPSGGRWIAGGSAFTDAFYAGDSVTACQLVDIDNILGYGANTVLANYEDNDAPTANQGWYFEPDANGTGFIEIEPIGGYAFIYEGLYLVLKFKKNASSTATKVFVNVLWGKEE